MSTSQRFLRGWQLSRLLRFAGVSLVGTLATQALLWLLVGRWNWHGAPANLAAVSLVSLPGYLANRHWVWERDRGQHSFRGEVAPYWAMSFSGLFLSTVFAWLAYRATPHAWAVSVANLSGFGVLWLAKFHLFDRFIFGDNAVPAVVERMRPVTSTRRPWRDVAMTATGFMPPDEGDALHAAALLAASACPGLPFVEIGSYCGRSTVWLGAAARAAATVLFAVDHHRGSEENQAGWEWHDPTLVDPVVGQMDTLPFFRRTIFVADLEDVVIGVVGRSPVVAKHWTMPCAFVFIDGGHGVEPARADYAGWTPHVAPGGFLAIHDVFPDRADGGRPPYEDIYLPALRSGHFTEISHTGSLRVLRRQACSQLRPVDGE